MRKDVFFLGAGFSKFIVPNMPLMYDLGNHIVKNEYLKEFHNSEFVKTKNVESFMSYLSEEYPFESESVQLRKKAAFKDVSGLIFDLIGSYGTVCEADNVDVLSLMGAIIERKVPLITLNYDLILEGCIKRKLNFMGRSFEVLDSYPAPFTSLASRSGLGAMSNYPKDQPKIYKLHGSINWFYSGRSSYYGESIFVRSEGALWDLRADKVPLIIPPTYSKTSYFNNETIRHLWTSAAKEIVAAERVILFGYSFPSSDSVVKTMLQNCIRAEAEIVVVNPDSNVLERVRSYFPDNNVSGKSDGSEFVKEYTEEKI